MSDDAFVYILIAAGIVVALTRFFKGLKEGLRDPINPRPSKPEGRELSNKITASESPAVIKPPQEVLVPPTKSAPLRLFLSYRREDSADATGRIYDRLIQHFGEGAVFKDVDSIPLGVDYSNFLDRAISGATMVLVVIGRTWLSASGQEGEKRLTSPRDFVRIEVASALRKNIPIIPLLVSGAMMPEPNSLPEEIRDLAYRNAVAVRPDPDFGNDMDRLIRGIGKLQRRGVSSVTSVNTETAANTTGRTPTSLEGDTVWAKVTPHAPSRLKRILASVRSKRRLTWGLLVFFVAVAVTFIGLSLIVRPQERPRTIVLILNQEASHIREAVEAFKGEVRSKMGPWQKFIERTGSADISGDEINKSAFEEALKEAGHNPDVIVTFGTQVSVYAARNNTTYPRFFTVVTDPIGSGLITKAEVESRQGNVAGFSNGIDKEQMVADLALCFPGKKFGFLYGAGQLQDLQMLHFLQSQTHIAINPIEATAANPSVDLSLAKNSDLFFGWNLFNTNIRKFVLANPDLPFIGPQYENIGEGAIASYGADFDRLGKISADFLIERFFFKGAALGRLPIQFPKIAKFLISKGRSQRFNLVRDPGCPADETP